MAIEPRQRVLLPRQWVSALLGVLVIILLLVLGRAKYVRTFYRTPAITSPVLLECSIHEIQIRAEAPATRSPAWVRESKGLRYFVERAILAELEDGTIVCPIWISTGPRFGPFMNVYTTYEWSSVQWVWALSESAQLVKFPTVPRCRRYYLILRESEPRTRGQKPSPRVAVQDVLPDEIVSGVLTIQQVSELPSLDTHKLHNELTKAFSEAIAARDEMRFRE